MLQIEAYLLIVIYDRKTFIVHATSVNNTIFLVRLRQKNAK
jgi:hypothetical protein